MFDISSEMVIVSCENIRNNKIFQCQHRQSPAAVSANSCCLTTEAGIKSAIFLFKYFAKEKLRSKYQSQIILFVFDRDCLY